MSARRGKRGRSPAEDLRPVEGAAADEELGGLARAIASPARVKILRRLSRGDACCGRDLVREIGLSQPTVSQHMRVLTACGLVEGRAEGRRVWYGIDLAALRRLKALVAGR
jgi:ArsR family transcriptional regulator